MGKCAAVHAVHSCITVGCRCWPSARMLSNMGHFFRPVFLFVLQMLGSRVVPRSRHQPCKRRGALRPCAVLYLLLLFLVRPASSHPVPVHCTAQAAAFASRFLTTCINPCQNATAGELTRNVPHLSSQAKQSSEARRPAYHGTHFCSARTPNFNRCYAFGRCMFCEAGRRRRLGPMASYFRLFWEVSPNSCTLNACTLNTRGQPHCARDFQASVWAEKVVNQL
jgi:hypothetical protein